MHQILFGVGIIIVVLSPLAAIGGVINHSTTTVFQALLSFCLGVAFIIIRNLVRELSESQHEIYLVNKKVNDLKEEFEAFRGPDAPKKRFL